MISVHMTTNRSAGSDHDTDQEGTMFDRDRYFATDHERRLLAEADAHRLATLAATTRQAPRPVAATGRRTTTARRVRRLRATLGAWLMDLGARLEPGPDPCDPAPARLA